VVADAEHKERILHDHAHLLLKTGDPHNQTLATHAVVWADILAAQHLTGGLFPTDQLHAAAIDDLSKETYNGYTAESWIELWRYFIHELLPIPAQQPWLLRVPGVTKFTNIVLTNTINPNLFKMSTPYEKLSTRLYDMAATRYKQAVKYENGGETVLAVESAKICDTAVYRYWLLRRSVAAQDTSYRQAELLDMIAQIATTTTLGTDGDTFTQSIVAHRARLVWSVPGVEQNSLLHSFPRYRTG